MFRYDYLSKQNTDCLKSILAICVILHHGRAEIAALNNTILGMAFTSLGYLAVSMFFFLSGFGLQIQYIKGKDMYIKLFPYVRLIPFYVVNIVVICTYYILGKINGHLFSYADFTLSFFWGRTVVRNGWYLQTILVFYIFFYCIYRFIHRRYFLAFIIAISIYSILAAIITNGTIYYESVWPFFIGITWANYKEKIDYWMSNKKNYIVSLVCNIIIFLVSFFIGNLYVVSEFLRVISKICSSILFSILLTQIIMHIRINYSITRKISRYYFELYLVQGIWFELLRGKYIFILNDYLYFALVFLLTFLLAKYLQPFINKISSNVSLISKRLFVEDI